MYILNDDRGNAYVWLNGNIVARRSGDVAKFDTHEGAEKALADFKAKRPWLI